MARKQVKDGGVSSGATRRVWVLVPTPRRCPPFPRRDMHGRNGRWEKKKGKKKGTDGHPPTDGLRACYGDGGLELAGQRLDDRHCRGAGDSGLGLVGGGVVVGWRWRRW